MVTVLWIAHLSIARWGRGERNAIALVHCHPFQECLKVFWPTLDFPVTGTSNKRLSHLNVHNVELDMLSITATYFVTKTVIMMVR